MFIITKKKNLYSYITEMNCDSSGVAILRMYGTNFSEGSYEAKIWNNHFTFFSTGKTAVKKMLEGLKLHKASGPDKISSRFLMKIAPGISPVQTLIFQASYDHGTIPSDWKGTFVTLLFMKGDKIKVSNYLSVFISSVRSMTLGTREYCLQPSHEVTRQLLQTQ